MKHYLLVAFAVVLSTSPIYAADAVSAADRAFIAKVSQGGMFEVKAGQAASDQGPPRTSKTRV